MILESLNIHISRLPLAVDAAILSLNQIMRKEEYLCKLIGVLTKFTKEQSDWSPGVDTPETSDEFSIILNDAIPLEVQALIYEIQAHVLLGMTHRGQLATAKKICQKALETYSESDHPLRRIRVVERLLYLAIIDGDTEAAIHLGATVITFLASAKVGAIVFN